MLDINENRPLVCLLGSGGNLGKAVRTILERDSLVEVQPIGWRPHNQAEFRIVNDSEIESQNGRIPQLIMNLSNSYFPNPNQNQLLEMRKAIVGVSKILSSWIREFRTPSIAISSYFQFCPKELRPWSLYSGLKEEARDNLIGAAEEVGAILTEFVLFDNYGGDGSRGKFLDIALESQQTARPMKASPGNQVLNLSHVLDVAQTIVQEAYTILMKDLPSSISYYTVKSGETLTLRQIVEEINQVALPNLEVVWGSAPYRSREVFEIWEIPYPNHKAFQPRWTLRSYLEHFFSLQRDSI